MKTASYTKTPQGDGFLFNVTPAPRALGGCSGIIVAIPIILFKGGGGLKSKLILIPIFIIATFLFLNYGGIDALEYLWILPVIALILYIPSYLKAYKNLDLRKPNHKAPSSFTVSPEYIEVLGQKFNKADIHRIIIRNAYDKEPKVILTGGTVPTGVGLGHDIRNALEQISYSLDIEAGGRATQLAGGMDEVTVHGLMTDVSRILGFS